jgi:hypothetical protein
MAHIQFLEGLSIAGSKDRENDDAMGATSSIAFVLDGVTSLADPPLMKGRSDAAWVAHLARDLLLKRYQSGLKPSERGLPRHGMSCPGRR